MATIFNARCVINTQLMKKMTQFVKMKNVQATKINPLGTSIIATTEHLMVNFSKKTAQIAIQK